MYRLLIATCLLLVVSHSAAFSIGPNKAISIGMPRLARSAEMPTTPLTSTSLNLRVKVDPNEKKEERLNPAVFKNALYLGSVAFAVLLPVIFLVAGSK